MINKLSSLTKKEPAVVVGAVVAIVTVVVAELPNLGVALDPAIQEHLVAIVGAVAALLGSLYTRARVTPL